MNTDTSAQNLLSLFTSLRKTPPRLILSPPSQPRRASVALILRMRPAPELVFEGREPDGYIGPVVSREEFGVGFPFDDFLRLPWVNHPNTVPELLFIRRTGTNGGSSSSSSSSSGARWSSHVAFPGGRQEPSDESAQYTALRETWEEIGIDLAESDFVQIGRLDEREITTSLGKRLLMILSPFVFLQTCPFTPTPDLQPTEVSTVHWIPLDLLTPPFEPGRWSHIDIDISTRLSPRNQLIRWALRGLVGKMQFGCILLPDEPDYVAEGVDLNMDFVDLTEREGSGTWIDGQGKRVLRLWGLSLGMTLDLVAHSPGGGDPNVLALQRSRSSSNASKGSPSPERPSLFGPKTPVTVPSSFEHGWFPEKLPESTGSSPKSPRSALVNGTGNGAPARAEGALGSQTAIATKGKPARRKPTVTIVDNRRRGVGPGVTAVFPRFSYPDVNFWIWVFGRRYRQVVRGWEESSRGRDKGDSRVNWSGAALSTFYQAVRNGLVVAMIVRGLATIGGFAGVTYWLLKRITEAAAV